MNIMEDRQRALSFFIPKEDYANGPQDITEKLYEVVPRDSVDAIKYIMHTASTDGVYYTVVFVQKRDEKERVVGFSSQKK